MPVNETYCHISDDYDRKLYYLCRSETAGVVFPLRKRKLYFRNMFVCHVFLVLVSLVMFPFIVYLRNHHSSYFLHVQLHLTYTYT